MKKQTGITLIALVITIVVLIILAAVAINLSLGNNGIFNRAKTAKEQYQNAQDYEETQIAKASNEIDSYVDGDRFSNNWTKLISEKGHNSDETAINLPSSYSELLINVGNSDSYHYIYYILKDMISDDYQNFYEGFGYDSYQLYSCIKVKNSKLYLDKYMNWNNDLTSNMTVTVYYK